MGRGTKSMATVASISHEESIVQNRNTWCLEVGSSYEEYSVNSANRFIKYIKKQPVVDLGSGDGAATNVFIKNGNKTTAVDINPEKLNCIDGAIKVETDFLTYLTKPLDNVFMHHALEHYVNYQQVLDAIGKYLKKNKYCYISVPKNDHVHSVHHVAFDSIEEIIPKGLELVASGSTDGAWQEYWIIARKV